MPKKLINPDRLFDGTAFRMSQAVVDTESSLLFVSGQVDWDLQHQVSRDTVPGQFKAALDNLRTVLTEAGAKVEDLLRMRIYIRGEVEDHVEAIRPTMIEFLGESRTAVTVIGVASLASRATLVEVEVVARIS